MSMELIILTPADRFLQAVEFNNEELKQELAKALEKYNGLIYTDDNIKDAKTDRATLNKFRDAIETKRKEIKAKCLEPYNAFEEKVRELTTLIDQPLTLIDERVKTYEEKAKADKKQILVDYWEGCAADIIYLVPFDKIFNPKWLNASAPVATSCEEMADITRRIKEDLKAITDLHSEYETAVKDKYLEVLNLSEALGLKSRLEERAAKLTEAPALKPQADSEIQEEAKPYDFRVWLNEAQKAALVAFLKSNNIKYGKVGQNG